FPKARRRAPLRNTATGSLISQNPRKIQGQQPLRNYFMSLYIPEVGNPQASAQFGRETREIVSANNSLDSRRKSKRLLTAVLLLAVAIGMGLGFWSLSSRLAPQLISSQASGEDD